MMKVTSIKSIACTLLIVANISLADANKNVLKEQLINAVRNNYNELKDATLEIKKIDYSGDYAYFCGVGLDSTGKPINTNNFIPVYDILMHRSENGVWKQVENFNSFSTLRKKIECRINEKLSNFLLKVDMEDDSCISVDKGNDERKNILNVIREDKEQKLLVTRLCKTSSIAYFCGASQDKNSNFISKTNGAINVSDIILTKKMNGKWEKIVEFGSFSSSFEDITCFFGKESSLLENRTLQDAVDKLGNNDQ
ncbi:hypothetical protein ACT3RR_19735 [Ewingella sp. AOP8-B2-18]